MSVSDLIPDYIEPMTAYRAFSLNHADLCSTAKSTVWEREMEAICGAGHHHPAPNSECSCGLWSLKRFKDVRKSFLPTHSHVYAKIEVYGRVFLGELHGYGPGFKSEKARIVEIYAPEWVCDETRMALVDRYGVPVLDLPEPHPLDLLEEKVDDLERRVRRMVENWRSVVEEQKLKDEAATLGKVEARDALKSRAHAYAYICQGRNGYSRPLCNNTRLEMNGSNPAVLLHSTYVATFTRLGLELNTGGWRTVTTKDRINMAASNCTDFQVYSTGEGAGCWAAYRNGHWSVGRDQAIPPWYERYITPDGTINYMNGDGVPRQMTLDGSEVSIRQSLKISKRTENKLKRAWMREHGWEIPFESGLVLPYKEA